VVVVEVLQVVVEELKKMVMTELHTKVTQVVEEMV
jgi:hypothetical protein